MADLESFKTSRRELLKYFSASCVMGLPFLDRLYNYRSLPKGLKVTSYELHFLKEFPEYLAIGSFLRKNCRRIDSAIAIEPWLVIDQDTQFLQNLNAQVLPILEMRSYGRWARFDTDTYEKIKNGAVEKKSILTVTKPPLGQDFIHRTAMTVIPDYDASPHLIKKSAFIEDVHKHSFNIKKMPLMRKNFVYLYDDYTIRPRRVAFVLYGAMRLSPSSLLGVARLSANLQQAVDQRENAFMQKIAAHHEVLSFAEIV